MKPAYQRCTQCVMDTSDPHIVFDRNGVCNHCHKYTQAIKISEEERAVFKRQLDAVHNIKGPYNCIIGVSGGLDSTFLLLHAVHDLRLRPLAVHVDNGWNTGLANQNIARQCATLGVDLHTIVLDWEEFRLMQLAILDAGLPDLEAPTDLFINYSLRAAARKFGIKYVLSGTNPQTESVMGSNWSYGQRDPIYLRGLFARYTGHAAKALPFRNWYLSLIEQSVGSLEIVRPLKFIDYSRKLAVERSVREVGWVEYARKHGESFITRFYQNYFLPVRFGFDKRKAHCSALILNGDMTRDQAIAAIESEPTSGPQVEAEIEYLCKKLQLPLTEFQAYMNAPKLFHQDYRTIKSLWMFRLAKYFKQRIGANSSLLRRVERLITS
jgi:N-acetyl sugar amidotransferase